MRISLKLSKFLVDLLEYIISLICNLVPFDNIMLGKGRPNVWVYNRYATNILSYHIYDNYSHGSWKVYRICTFHLPQYYSTSSGATSI